MTVSIARLRLPTIVGWAAILSLFAGCSDNDVQGKCGKPVSAPCTHDSGQNEDASFDKPSDAACACSVDPASSSNSVGIQSLDCYCSRSGACLDYATASAVCRPYPAYLFPYPACNLEVIRIQLNPYEGGIALIYDATTHALVGASSASDTPSLVCGDRRVVEFRAGTFPPADCARGAFANLCRGDGGDSGGGDVNDADDGDGNI